MEGGDIESFVVSDAVLPAAPKDADPFEGQGAQDRLVVFAGTLLLEVIGFGPGAFGDRLSGPVRSGEIGDT